MTSAEKILSGISDAAKQTAAQKAAETRALAEKVNADADAEIATRVAAIEKETATAVENIRKAGESAVLLTERDLLLQARRQVMAEVLESAKRAICAMDDAAYFDFLWDCLAPFATAGTLYLSEKDLARNTADFTRRLASVGITLSATPRVTDGGFVLVAGEVEINGTLPALIREKQAVLMDEINRILFAAKG